MADIMVTGDKIVFVKTVPECATFAEIPSGVPAVVAKGWRTGDFLKYRKEQEEAGFTYIRIQGSHVGYVSGREWFYRFVPTDSIGPRHNFN